MATQAVFDTLTPLTGGTPGTAPAIFSATTDQTLAVLTTAGAVADLVANGTFKAGDIIYVNYSVSGTAGHTSLMVTSTSSGSLVNYGLLGAQIYTGTVSDPGGANPLTITDDHVSTTSFVTASIQTSENVVEITRVIAQAGSLKIDFTADPGVSEIRYLIVNA